MLSKNIYIRLQFYNQNSILQNPSLHPVNEEINRQPITLRLRKGHCDRCDNATLVSAVQCDRFSSVSGILERWEIPSSVNLQSVKLQLVKGHCDI